ncbi:hypothetical protein GQ53DRAFT_741866 [Thozetella sp. PMI_491]|nr:hypothetical protein GQ53DRAFT_741866 [Thozetella sp. PMI_491]
MPGGGGSDATQLPPTRRLGPRASQSTQKATTHCPRNVGGKSASPTQPKAPFYRSAVVSLEAPL